MAHVYVFACKYQRLTSSTHQRPRYFNHRRPETSSSVDSQSYIRQTDTTLSALLRILGRLSEQQFSTLGSTSKPYPTGQLLDFSEHTLAQQDHLRLVPKDIQWSNFCHFISNIKRIDDAFASKRYWYGELRLSRLNLYAPLFFRKAYFEQVHGQYGDYFARLYGPVLFVFASLTTLLNCLQVGLAAEQVSPQRWVTFQSVSRWFSVISLIGAAFVAACFVLLWLWIFSDEWIFAIRSRLQRKVEQHQSA